MGNQDFSVAFTVGQSPAEVYTAVKNVRGWWWEGLEGRSGKVGDEFTYRYEDLHRSTQKVTELVPGRRVVWTVTKSALSFVKDTAEWDGTRLIFEISIKSGKTELRMTHVGLTSALECFDACVKGWTYYFTQSLKRLITTGKGRPEPRKRGPVKS
ncbi:MAG: SRPBCC family protein, partial [bacterium]